MMKYNLHTHTKRCNHAYGEDREYVENAIKSGMKVLGFSDHCPQFFPKKDYYSFFRMLPEQAYEYAENVRSLQKEYKSDIKKLRIEITETALIDEAKAEAKRFCRSMSTR